MGPIQSAMNQAVQTGAAAATMTTHFGEQLAQKQVQKAEQKAALSSEAFNLSKQSTTEALQETNYRQAAEQTKLIGNTRYQEAVETNTSNRDEKGKFRTKEAQKQAKEVQKNLMADSFIAQEVTNRYTGQADFYNSQRKQTMATYAALKAKKDAILSSGLYTKSEAAEFNKQFNKMAATGKKAAEAADAGAGKKGLMKAYDEEINNPDNRKVATMRARQLLRTINKGENK